MRKRKKNSRMRGQTTHGWGSMKKHRGSGNRGGKGNAGSGKRADSKKPSLWKNPSYMGKHGFTSLHSSLEVINIYNLEMRAASLTGDPIDLGNVKLLGKGTPSRKWNLKVKAASKKAVEKIEKAGGKVQCDVPVASDTEQSS